jgi:hypothetical protein
MNTIIIILVAIIGGIVAYYISHDLGKGPVVGSTIVTLGSGLIFTGLEYLGVPGTVELAIVATTAGYAGMVSKKYVNNMTQMVVVSIISGVLYILSTNLFVGIGGRLGTIAAVSCFAFIGLKRLICYKIPSFFERDDCSF